MNYTSLVTKKRQYKYSANICFDMKDDDKLAEFIPNITTTEILREYLMEIINGNADVHSRILYGSYGTGKSHLLTVISDLLGHVNANGNGIGQFLKAIAKYDKELATEIKRYLREEKPYLVVPIYANFDDFDKCITYSLKKELERNNINICLKSYFDDALKLINNWSQGEESNKKLKEIYASNNISEADLLNGLENYDSKSEKEFNIVFGAMTYGVEFVSEAGNMIDNITLANSVIAENYRGIIFVFDEFGRYIEDTGENIKIKDVQDLAEFCDHSDFDDYLILVSHKQLSLYTDKMKKSISDEWKKIEGRFKATSINVKYDQCLSLIPHIIPKTKEWDKFKKRYHEQLNELYTQAYDFKGFLLPPENDGINPFEGGYPLHPITLYALDRLSKRVAQNERTFFTYLASDEDYSLFSQLEKLDLKEFHFIGLDAIYDYFEENICSYRSGDAREIYKKYQVAVNKLGNDSEKNIGIRVLKAMAVIYIINDSGTLASDIETLINVIDANRDLVRNAIADLEKKKIIKFMRQYGYYDFLDSSIYDFDSMINERLLFITDDTAVSVLNEEFSDFVIYPYDYNWKYHMNRIFLPIFSFKEELAKKTLTRFIPKYYDGIIAFVLDKKFEISDYLNETNLPDRTILIINQNEEEILYEVKRYVAIKYYYSIRDELKKDDPTVERELELYLNEQKSVLFDIIVKWRNIGMEGIAVVSEKQEYEARNDKDISEIASTIMNKSFPKTIIVNNDLINKNIVSGAIRIARSKALWYIMNNKENMLDDCGLMSPEHSIIRSVLSKNGLFDGEDNIGALNILPSGEVAGRFVFDEIDKYVKKCIKGQISIKELYDVLKQPPYGLRDGYIPILLAYELRNYENISIYFHGSEHDYCEEELLKALESPEDYSLYICNWSENETAYIECLEKIFAGYIDKGAKNRLKELYEAMNKHFVAISKSARTTNKYVSENAKLYREIMCITHKDYNKFFFETLLQLDSDLLELSMIIQKIVLELEGVTKLQIQTIEKAIRAILEIEHDVSITAELSRLYETEWKEKRFKSFDYQTGMMLDYLANMNLATSDEEITQEIGKVVTGFEIEYWNDSKIEDFYEAFSKMVRQLNNYQIQDNVGSNEIKVTISLGNNEEKITQFNKSELSGTSQLMFNKIRSTIDNFGESISYDEKMQVLAKIFSEIM